MSPRGQYRDWDEFVPAVHHSFQGKSLCGIERGRNKTLLSKNRPDITCKKCIKKLLKSKHAVNHFEDGLFEI